MARNAEFPQRDFRSRAPRITAVEVTEMLRKYVAVSGVLFGVVAALQAVRALNQWPVHVGGFEVPVSASWIAMVVAGFLCVWAFWSLRK